MSDASDPGEYPADDVNTVDDDVNPVDAPANDGAAPIASASCVRESMSSLPSDAQPRWWPRSST